MRRTVVLVALLASACATGCAAIPEPRFSQQTDEYGQRILVLEMPGRECPGVVSLEANRGHAACALLPPVHVIWYGVGEPEDRAHEIDHLKGLRHGPWFGNCAPIISAGATQWTAGWYLCKRNGQYQQYASPL